MSEQDHLNEALDEAGVDPEIENALRQLVPVRPAFGANHVLAEALGRAEKAQRFARRQAWIWRGVATALAASLAVVVWKYRQEPARQAFTTLVNVPAINEIRPDPPTLKRAYRMDGNTASPTDCSYLVLRQRVLSDGIAELPNSPSDSETALPLPGEESTTESRLGAQSH